MASQARSKSTGKAPVTRHPLFPAMIALWFGALFGLGSLAVRASLLESLILSLSLDVLLPFAAPPLGLKARLIFAVLMAAGGVALGALLARRIARPKPEQTERRRGFGVRVPGRRHGAEEQPEPQAFARRRPLAMEEEQPRDMRFEAAPLPGGTASILDVTQIDLQDHDFAGEEPLALDAFVAEEPAPFVAESHAAAFAPEPAPLPEPEPAAERQEFRPAASEELLAQNFHPPVSMDEAGDLDLTDFADDEPEFAGSDDSEVTAAADNDDDYGRMIEALRDPGPSGEVAAAADPAVWSDEPPAAIEAAPMAEQPDGVLPVVPAMLMPQPVVVAAVSDAASAPTRRIETAELGELSPVELIERLAMAMRQRAHSGPMPEALVEAVSSLAVPAPAELAEPVAIARFDPPAPAPEALAVSEPAPEPQSAPSPLSLPAALRPIDFGDYGDHDEEHDLPVPPRSFAAPAQPVAAPAQPVAELAQPESGAEPVEEPDSEVPEDSYPSLLEVNRPSVARQEFVRIEEPEDESQAIEPVVIFPGHGARAGQRFAAPDPAAQAPDPLPPPPQIGAEAQVPQMRRFDAPAAIAASSPAGAPRQEPEEAERALRSALATLQRMSGAA